MKPLRRSHSPAQSRSRAANHAAGTGALTPLQEPLPLPQRLQAVELWIAVQLPAAADARALEELGARALQFSPRVSLEPPDGLLFEVRASLSLFGGVTALCQAFAVQCPQGCSLALAPTPLAALALARAGVAARITDVAQLTGAVAELPLCSLRWPEDTLARLLSMGVRSIGEVLRLPRAGFARRCGPELLVALDRLLGRRSDPRSVLRLRERFRARRELYHESSDQERILRVVQGMLQEMEVFLRQRQCGVTALELRLSHRDLPDTRCRLSLALPQHLAAELGALLREHLARLPLPAVVRACVLRSGRLLEQAPVSGGLWKPGEHGGAATLQIPAFIERLRARLGNDAVYGLCLVPEHRPEAAWSATEPVLEAKPRVPAAPGRPAQQRPLWLLQAPRALALRDGRPCQEGEPLQLLSGPERLETGWWDGGDICRDYYVARSVQGERLWVFREREAPHGWFLHGMFG